MPARVTACLLTCLISHSHAQCWQPQAPHRPPFKSLAQDLGDIAERLEETPYDSDLKCSVQVHKSTGSDDGRASTEHVHTVNASPRVGLLTRQHVELADDFFATAGRYAPVIIPPTTRHTPLTFQSASPQHSAPITKGQTGMR